MGYYHIIIIIVEYYHIILSGHIFAQVRERGGEYDYLDPLNVACSIDV